MKTDSIFITGATGYIGRHFVKDILEKGYKVSYVFRDIPLPFISRNLKSFRLPEAEGNISFFKQILTSINPSVVLHLASNYTPEHTEKDVRDLIASNILLGSELLEAMSCSGIKKFITAGTLLQNFENHAYNPTNLYAATKEAFANIVRYYTEVKGICAIELKLGDSYGADDKRQKIIPMIAKAARTQSPLLLSGGEQVIQVTHLSDIIEGIKVAIDQNSFTNEKPFSSYSVFSGEAISIRDLVSLYERLHKVTIPCKWHHYSYRARETFKPITSIKRLPGWKPTVSLKKGLLAIK